MSQLNQYAISQVLGSKMRPVKTVRFGGFGVLETTAEYVRAKQSGIDGEEGPHFTYDHDRVVARAFEQVRDGASPDSILWNRRLQQEFTRRCRDLGLDAPEAFLNRRLLNIRKDKRRYEKYGIRLSPTSKQDAHPSIVPQFAHVIEFALVRLRYRFGASIDDILLDPDLSDQFERLALEVAPQLSPQEIRLGALYIRKSRDLPRKAQAKLAGLDPSVVDHQATRPQRLSDMHVEDAPEGLGLIELKEGAKYLYIARNENLKLTIGQFLTGRAFDIVASGFWRPDLNSITLRFAAGTEFGRVAVAQWELRLIRDRQPVFNWPIHKKAA